MLTEKDYLNKILLGDSKHILKQIPDGVIDLIASDPPYQLSPINKTSTENTKIVKGFLGKCYSDDTEVLTIDGWRLIKDIVETKDETVVYTLNKETMNIELQKIEQHYKREYVGDMYYFTGRSTDLLVTPEHQVVYINNYNKKICQTRADSINNCFSFIGYGNYTTGENAETITINTKTYPIKPFMFFMGLFLGDGFTCTRKKHKQKQDFCGIAAKEERKRDNARKILKELGLNYNEHSNQFIIYEPVLLSYLKQFGGCKTKYIDSSFFRYDKEILTHLFNGMMETDGCIASSQYFSVSRRLADDFQHLCFLLGKSSNVSKIKKKEYAGTIKGIKIKNREQGYAVLIHKNKKTHWFEKIDHKNKKRRLLIESYNGFVYDVGVSKNHIIYVRRNGKALWSSNSWDILPDVELLREALRVMKPGAFSFWLMSPRQDCQVEFIIRLKQAGFIINYTSLYWLYNSGFPKNLNLSKAADKKLGCERAKVPATGGLAGESGDTVGCFTGSCTDDTPISDEAKRLNGAYSPGFKPAVEVIVVAMKPLDHKTYLEQAIKNSKGCFWIEDCRIPYASEKDKEQTLVGYDEEDTKNSPYSAQNIDGGFGHKYVPKPRGSLTSSTEAKFGYKECVDIGSENGRFPGNILVQDDTLNNRVNTVSRKSMTVGGFGTLTFADNKKEEDHLKIYTERGYDDEGSFSRFFDLDKWYNEKIKQMPRQMREELQDVFPFLIVPKPSTTEREEGLENFEAKQKWLDGGGGTGITDRENIKSRNIHPTTKPLKLFSYLIYLGSREGETVLDPFCGSGTTAVAAYQCNRQFLGIEREPEYHKISMARVTNVQSQSKLSSFF